MNFHLKLHWVSALGAAAILLAGCASTPTSMVLGCVGPAPNSVADGNSPNGMLTVYSAYQTSADFNSRDPYRREYSNYKILGADGSLKQNVDNNSGSILQRPLPVSLAPGNYRVEAQANGFGLVTVPVVIAAGQSTFVHLEGGFQWPNENAFNDSNAVRLPDGQVVGWKSSTAMK